MSASHPTCHHLHPTGQPLRLARPPQLALVLTPADPLPDFLRSIRPRRPSHKKCTESKANHFRNIT